MRPCCDEPRPSSALSRDHRTAASPSVRRRPGCSFAFAVGLGAAAGTAAADEARRETRIAISAEVPIFISKHTVAYAPRYAVRWEKGAFWAIVGVGHVVLDLDDEIRRASETDSTMGLLNPDLTAGLVLSPAWRVGLTLSVPLVHTSNGPDDRPHRLALRAAGLVNGDWSPWRYQSDGWAIVVPIRYQSKWTRLEAQLEGDIGGVLDVGEANPGHRLVAQAAGQLEYALFPILGLGLRTQIVAQTRDDQFQWSVEPYASLPLGAFRVRAGVLIHADDPDPRPEFGPSRDAPFESWALHAALSLSL